MGPFQDKVVIVTGGGSGIGRALTQQLAEAGATVVVADIDGARAREVAEHVSPNGRATAAELDVTDNDAVKAVVAGVAEAHGRIDLMFNNAGVAAVGLALDMGPEEWDRMLNVNVRGVIHGVLAVGPVMVEQGYGHIVNTASVAGLVPTPYMTAYAATKHAVVGLSSSLRAELKSQGVTVSVVCPGIIDTPMLDANTLVNVDLDLLTENMPMRPYDVDRCARDILRGVAKKTHRIVVTKEGRISYLAQRFAPWLVDLFVSREADKGRRLHQDR